MLLENRTAIITGGGKGIGRGIALKFAKEGCNVAICDLDIDESRKTADEIIAIGRKALAIKTDVVKSNEEIKIVKHDKGIYELKSAKLEKYFAMLDFDNADTNEVFRKYLLKQGINDFLKEKGVQEGEIVIISGKDFVYQDD